MPINHNFDKFAIALSRAPARFEKQVMRDLGQMIDTYYSRFATQRYMQEGPTTFTNEKPPRPRNLGGPLRRVSERLARAVSGQFTDGKRESSTLLDVSDSGLIWTRVIRVPYAAIHEYGGSFKVPTTPDMESYFWAKAYETGMDPNNEWRLLALAARKKPYFNINIPKRPYSEPALNDVIPVLEKEGSELIETFINDVLEDAS